MSQEQNYFKLGMFVLGAGVILVVAIVVLGTAQLFEKHFAVESYVDESVQGLDVGAPVKYRGVKIGELEKLDFVAKVYGNQDGRIRLLMKFHPEAAPKGKDGKTEESPAATIDRLVSLGMRVRLASAGLTGGVYLELDLMDPKEHPVKPIDWTPQNSYMPSVQSVGTRLTSHVETILEQIERMKLDEISAKIGVVLDGLDRMVKTVEPGIQDLRNAAQSADGLLKDFRKVVTGEIISQIKTLLARTDEVIANEIAPLLRGIRATTDKLPASVERIDTALDRVTVTLRRVDRTFSEDTGSIDEALDNLRVVSQDLRDLTGQVKRHPAGAIFGEAPPKKAVNK
ncbi:MAG TPA: MlaD family protein [Planctomycetota bacterium]|nr:MlaD family protein [Planctomycetota bacterium]